MFNRIQQSIDAGDASGHNIDMLRIWRKTAANIMDEINSYQAAAMTGSIGSSGEADDKGNVRDNDGKVIGKIPGAEAKAGKFPGHCVDDEGDVLDEEGKIVAEAVPAEEEGDERTEAG